MKEYASRESGAAPAAARCLATEQIIDVESVPPERNTATGTSLRRRRRTASSKIREKVSKGADVSTSGPSSRDQNRQSLNLPSSVNSKAEPAGRRSISEKKDSFVSSIALSSRYRAADDQLGP